MKDADLIDKVANSAKTLGYTDALKDLCDALKFAGIPAQATADILSRMMVAHIKYKLDNPS